MTKGELDRVGYGGVYLGDLWPGNWQHEKYTYQTIFTESGVVLAFLEELRGRAEGWRPIDKFGHAVGQVLEQFGEDIEYRFPNTPGLARKYTRRAVARGPQEGDWRKYVVFEDFVLRSERLTRISLYDTHVDNVDFARGKIPDFALWQVGMVISTDRNSNITTLHHLRPTTLARREDSDAIVSLNYWLS